MQIFFIEVWPEGITEIQLRISNLPKKIVADTEFLQVIICETKNSEKIPPVEIPLCRNIQEDIILTYEDDFSKYKKRVNPDLLRTTMRGICHQAGEKLTYKQISADYQSSQIREALRLLTLAGIVTPVVATSGNGIPLDAEADEKSMKVLFLDPGLLLAVLQLEGDLSQQLIELILAGTPQELVNK